MVRFRPRLHPAQPLLLPLRHLPWRHEQRPQEPRPRLSPKNHLRLPQRQRPLLRDLLPEHPRHALLQDPPQAQECPQVPRIRLEVPEARREGEAPNYVVVEQRYFDIEIFQANDDHPSHDVAANQMFMKEVYEILRKSPQWKEMAILITYDEHGDFFDHVPTPVMGVPNPDGIIGPHP